jgi:hypothetical protein
MQLTKSFLITFYYCYVICFSHHINGIKERDIYCELCKYKSVRVTAIKWRYIKMEMDKHVCFCVVNIFIQGDKYGFTFPGYSSV